MVRPTPWTEKMAGVFQLKVHLLRLQFTNSLEIIIFACYRVQILEV